MPWTPRNYPDAMKNLADRIRLKAIEIANALLEEGYPEGSAIPIAISQSKKWAEGIDKKDWRDNFHVVPHPEGWAVRQMNAAQAMSVLPDVQQARDQAIMLARNAGADVIIHDEHGEIVDHVSLLDEVQPIVKRTE
ncbi:MAG: DUF2188 domain-containing protein [Pleurocapsa minor GSE-CHR-MK-17-07R]|nr:DUF2188 domain-containing protein [Pleurocapsa minor GSE-CHR-MK 17-07R]